MSKAFKAPLPTALQQSLLAALDADPKLIYQTGLGKRRTENDEMRREDRKRKRRI